jgi:hypothetical protein
VNDDDKNPHKEFETLLARAENDPKNY